MSLHPPYPLSSAPVGQMMVVEVAVDDVEVDNVVIVVVVNVDIVVFPEIPFFHVSQKARSSSIPFEQSASTYPSHTYRHSICSSDPAQLTRSVGAYPFFAQMVVGESVVEAMVVTMVLVAIGSMVEVVFATHAMQNASSSSAPFVQSGVA
jgi:hypothetical protein